METVIEIEDEETASEENETSDDELDPYEDSPEKDVRPPRLKRLRGTDHLSDVASGLEVE